MARNPNESLDIINISDSESEPGDRPFLPQASLASSDVVSNHWQPTSSRCESPDILVIDSTDSEDLDELEAKLKDAHLGNKPNACSHPYITESIGHTRPARRIESQADILVLSSSEEDTLKLTQDRKDTLKDFTVELSRAFQDHLFVDHLERKLSVHDCSISFFDPPPQSESLIRFRRQHIARYDNRLKEWVPTTPHAALEDLYVLFLSADTLALALLQEDITEMLASLRRTHCLTTHSQIFIMIDGLNGYYKRKKGRKDERNTIESALTSLQALERCFIVHVEGAEDTAQWLFNITGDLGIRPHRRIQESFLPFCTDTQVKCGSSKADTYKKMLQQIRNVTESAADGIIQEAPTLRELFEGYAREPDMHNRHDRLKGVVVSNRKDGAAKSRILNQALSRKVHDIIWGEDPLILV
ncbi:ERCC4 domain protein, partial [Rhizoctonia solani AG-3 Rhs1AP]